MLMNQHSIFSCFWMAMSVGSFSYLPLLFQRICGNSNNKNGRKIKTETENNLLFFLRIVGRLDHCKYYRFLQNKLNSSAMRNFDTILRRLKSLYC